jgi:membrane fusion protein (multidrug efflux system)
VLADDSVYPQRGRFLAADREIDPKTGTIRISAAFPNPAHTLRPGQYARVRAETKSVENAIVVPQRAVTEVQGAYQVRVVGSDNRIATRRVKVGDRVGGGWIIETGVQPSDRVVVEGASATDGTVVSPKPWERPAQGD